MIQTGGLHININDYSHNQYNEYIIPDKKQAYISH